VTTDDVDQDDEHDQEHDEHQDVEPAEPEAGRRLVQTFSTCSRAAP
jgi:hypothetical protein